MAALMDNIKKPYSASEVKCLLHQLLKGIEYCHDHYVVHRDLKLSNLLLTEKGVLKIGMYRYFFFFLKFYTEKRTFLASFLTPPLLFSWLTPSVSSRLWTCALLWTSLATYDTQGGDALVQGTRTSLWRSELHDSCGHVVSRMYIRRTLETCAFTTRKGREGTSRSDDWVVGYTTWEDLGWI